MSRQKLPRTIIGQAADSQALKFVSRVDQLTITRDDARMTLR